MTTRLGGTNKKFLVCSGSDQKSGCFKMERGANSDVFFLTDEKFDFDVSLSPASSTGEDIEDEVFVGPVSHSERCVSVSLASRLGNRCIKTSWSPLSGDQLEAICEEAQKLASELQGREQTQTKPALRSRSGIGVGVVLPSRPAAPSASRSFSAKNQVKTRLQPPGKLSSSWRRSPNSSRTGSCEDLLSDSASVASDVSDSSLNSSTVSKRSLAPPSKSVQTRSGVKPPSDSRLRNTSSSSSSVSSFNSSISLSPANKGKSNSSSQCSMTRATQKGRSVAPQPSNPPLAAAGRRSLSLQSRKPSNPLALKRSESPTQTPVRKGTDRTSSVPSAVRAQSGVKTKTQALVPPAPNATLRESSSPNPSKMLKPKRLVSVKNGDCVPQRSVLGTVTPSGGSGSAVPLKARRPSALPTPIRSRPSVLSQSTPQSQIRPIKAVPTHCAPNSLPPSDSPESVELPVIQPLNLEEEEPVQVPPTITTPDQMETTASPDALCQSKSETTKEEPKIEVIKMQEILLLDLPTPALQPQEKLLIDLSNTPNLIRTKTSASELIDLSSPLIKWSPDDKKEKDALLINLSY
uniref:G2 and S phase-expressed protein 1 N-terminal domain-containing protein n=1 Tax=Knipowitschia caucasica TaxID=637954 RepID=A0AAV2KX05_KNICA